MLAVVAGERAAGLVDDVSGGTRHELVEGGAREEAEVLALGLVRHRQVRGAGSLAHVRLGELAEREPEALELVRAQAGEHVCLVLRGVGRGAEERAVGVAGDARVVAGGEAGGAQLLREREHGVEADVAVAAHARVRRAPGLVLADVVVDHLLLEVRARIESDMRRTHPVGERTGVDHGLRRAAAPRAVGARVRPQLEGHGHDVVAFVEGSLCRDRAVDPAAHGDEGAVGVRREPWLGFAECAMQCVGGEVLSEIW